MGYIETRGRYELLDELVAGVDLEVGGEQGEGQYTSYGCDPFGSRDCYPAQIIPLIARGKRSNP